MKKGIIMKKGKYNDKKEKIKKVIMTKEWKMKTKMKKKNRKMKTKMKKNK